MPNDRCKFHGGRRRGIPDPGNFEAATRRKTLVTWQRWWRQWPPPLSEVGGVPEEREQCPGRRTPYHLFRPVPGQPHHCSGEAQSTSSPRPHQRAAPELLPRSRTNGFGPHRPWRTVCLHRGQPEAKKTTPYTGCGTSTRYNPGPVVAHGRQMPPVASEKARDRLRQGVAPRIRVISDESGAAQIRPSRG
jgi:hypothetical protein